jgi:hypothetical protein
MVKTVRLVNLTPHELNIYIDGKVALSIPPPPEGTPIPRVQVKSEIVGEIDVDGVSIPIRKVMYGDVENLPEEKEDTVYVVSTFVTLALREEGIERRDLLSPATNVDSAVRDNAGRVVGVKYLQMLW